MSMLSDQSASIEEYTTYLAFWSTSASRSRCARLTPAHSAMNDQPSSHASCVTCVTRGYLFRSAERKRPGVSHHAVNRQAPTGKPALRQVPEVFILERCPADDGHFRDLFSRELAGQRVCRQ